MEQATHTARELLKNPETALDTLVREELGLDPSDLGSPLQAALSSLASFAVGAFVPILPFLLAQGRPAVIASGGLCAAVLLAVGGVLGFLTGSGPVKPALRMFGLALAAVTVTVLAGRLVGATLQ